MAIVPCICEGKVVAHESVKMTGRDGPFYKYNIQFECLTGPNTGARVWFSGGFKDKGNAFTKKVMRTCGWDDTRDPNGQEWGKKKDGSIHKVEIDIIIEKYKGTDGTDREKGVVQFVNPIGAGGLSDKIKMSNMEKSAWAEEFMAGVKAEKESGVVSGSMDETPSKPQGGPPANPDEDDSIPF